MNEKLALGRSHGRGIFHVDPEQKYALIKNVVEQPNGIKHVDSRREIKTLIHKKPDVTTVDYAMKWKDHKKDDFPSSTHELAFDMVNGFDEDHVYVSGMTVNMIARVNKKDPTKQTLFLFPRRKEENGNRVDAQPHTIIFANTKSDELKGKVWVGIEEQGLIVKLDMNTILSKYEDDVIHDRVVKLTEADYETTYDVRITGDNIPTPINTRPHGFCFDYGCKNIWFTGKLTNTVGRVKVDGSEKEIAKSLQHFELPTLGAVPIYVALGPDKNIWGTSLANSTIFRVTTGENPIVDEMTITSTSENRRPITIKPDPRPNKPFMWFSNEAGHSVCRLDTEAFELQSKKKENTDGKGSKCQCSSGCKYLFRGSEFVNEVITEFPIPKINHHMLLGGLAITKEGAIWTQSYMAHGENIVDNLPDYVLKLRFDKHHPAGRSGRVNITGLPIEYYELPTKNATLHRISVAPDENESVWFTLLAADRLGTIEFKEEAVKEESKPNKRQRK